MYQKLIFIFLCGLMYLSTEAQVNPLGVYVDFDGKVKFWECEANHRGYIGDTIMVYSAKDTFYDDACNIKYDQLTFIEAPRDRWMTPSNLDPSVYYDTSRTELDDSVMNNFNSYLNYIQTFDYTIITLPDSASVHKVQPQFSDEFRGANISDSLLPILKANLQDFISNHWGHKLEYEVKDSLRRVFSEIDTVIEKQAVYDYLVDRLLFYNYKDGKLQSVCGYHWDYGIEFDSLRYDKKGNLIYFSRENTGLSRTDLYFTYNKHNQLTQAECYMGGDFDEKDPNRLSNSIIEHFRFTYNKKGVLNSRSYRSDSEKEWTTIWYKLK